MASVALSLSSWVDSSCLLVSGVGVPDSLLGEALNVYTTHICHVFACPEFTALLTPLPVAASPTAPSMAGCSSLLDSPPEAAAPPVG